MTTTKKTCIKIEYQSADGDTVKQAAAISDQSAVGFARKSTLAAAKAVLRKARKEAHDPS